MALYKDGNPVSGLNSIPRLTLAQYNALNVKPEFWVRTDAPESYKKLSADQVSYDSNNTVKDELDGITVAVDPVTLSGNPRATNVVNKSKIFGKQVVINVTFTSAITASNSPGMVYIRSNTPKIFSVLSCVRLASNGDIEAVVGAYSLTNGTVYVKEVTNGSNYALTGCYTLD